MKSIKFSNVSMIKLKQRILFSLVFLNLFSFALATGNEHEASSAVVVAGMAGALAVVGLKRKLNETIHEPDMVKVASRCSGPTSCSI